MCSECHQYSCPSGCPNAPETVHICPRCGGEIEEQYYTQDGMCLGCDCCLERKYAQDELCSFCGEVPELHSYYIDGKQEGCDCCVKEKKEWS